MKKLNDVLGYPLKIYQDTDFFCFSIDSIILAKLVNIRLKDKKIVDLGTGNGIIPLIMSLRTKNSIEGVEIQKDLANLALESIKYNKLQNQIRIYNQDMLLFASKDKYNTYDLIVSNPPYFKVNEKSTKNQDIHKTIARHEVKITINQIVKISSKLLKEGGKLAMVSRTDRFIEILEIFKKYKIEPKYIRFVYDNISLSPNLFYIEGINHASSGLIIDKPFIMYNLDGTESQEYRNLGMM